MIPSGWQQNMEHRQQSHLPVHMAGYCMCCSRRTLDLFVVLRLVVKHVIGPARTWAVPLRTSFHMLPAARQVHALPEVSAGCCHRGTQEARLFITAMLKTWCLTWGCPGDFLTRPQRTRFTLTTMFRKRRATARYRASNCFRGGFQKNKIDGHGDRWKRYTSEVPR